MSNHNWDNGSIATLSRLYQEKVPLSEIAIVLNRSIGSVRSKAHRIGIGNKPFWTKEEEEYLKNNYKSYNLQQISEHIGREKSNVCRKAKELGIQRNHKKLENPIGQIPWRIKYAHLKKTPEELRKINSEKAKRTIAKYGHHKGMLGKIHSEEARKKLSKHMKKQWDNPYSSFNTDEHRQNKSDALYNYYKNNDGIVIRHSRSKQGKREDLNGLYVRSTWEANYARYLNFLIDNKKLFKWEYEPETFYFEEIKRGTRSYTPDFKVWETEQSTPYFVEIKGWMDDKSKIRLSRMAKYYPEIKIELVRKEDYYAIKQWSRLIPNWED